MVVIYPLAGREKETIQQLLNMAKHPKDVRTSTDTVNGTGYVALDVPEELAERYWAAVLEVELAGEPKEAETEEPEEAEEAPAPRRRGRPRKQQKAEVVEDSEATGDDNEDSEE